MVVQNLRYTEIEKGASHHEKQPGIFSVLQKTGNLNKQQQYTEYCPCQPDNEAVRQHTRQYADSQS